MRMGLMAVALAACCGIAGAEQRKGVYTGDALVGATIDSLVAKFASGASEPAPASADRVLVLVDGRREGVSRADAQARIGSAKSVEVMGRDGAYVVNVVTR